MTLWPEQQVCLRDTLLCGYLGGKSDYDGVYSSILSEEFSGKTCETKRSNNIQGIFLYRYQCSFLSINEGNKSKEHSPSHPQSYGDRINTFLACSR